MKKIIQSVLMSVFVICSLGCETNINNIIKFLSGKQQNHIKRLEK